MNGHTKGPWKVWNDRVWTDEPLAEMKEICSISGNRGDRDANARLIASAPELLRLLKWHIDCSTGTPDLDGAKGRAAIAAAERGTP